MEPMTKHSLLLSLAMVMTGCGPAQLSAQAVQAWPRVRVSELSARRLATARSQFPSRPVREAIVAADRAETTTGLDVCVAGNGTIARVDVTTASGVDGFDADAIDAVRAWRFQPAASGVCTELTMRFARESRSTARGGDLRTR